MEVLNRPLGLRQNSPVDEKLPPLKIYSIVDVRLPCPMCSLVNVQKSPTHTAWSDECCGTVSIKLNTFHIDYKVYR